MILYQSGGIMFSFGKCSEYRCIKLLEVTWICIDPDLQKKYLKIGNPDDLVVITRVVESESMHF